MTDQVLANHVDDHSYHPRTLHEPYNRRRSLIPATLPGGEAQHAHLFVCGRECGRKRGGTTRTNRHREHLSRICPDSAFAQVKGQIPRQGSEPAGGLEPPTPCLQAKLTAIRLVLPRVRSAVTCGYVRVDRVRSSVKDHHSPGSVAAFPSPSLPQIPSINRGIGVSGERSSVRMNSVASVAGACSCLGLR